jgi:hypothetical protein
MKGDTLPAKLALARGRVSEPFLRAVEWALALDETKRPQSVEEWQRALEGQTGARDTARVALQSAPTFISAPLPPKTPPAPVAKPPSRPAPGKSGSGWRWVGIGAVVLVSVLAFSAWNKQRSAQTAVPEATRPAPAPKPALKQSAPDAREAARDRPERERTDRPGDKQRPGAEEFRQKVLQEFRSGDRDNDGYLSREELRSRFPGMEREYARVDADGDGRVSPEEFLRMRRLQAQQRLKKQ